MTRIKCRFEESQQIYSSTLLIRLSSFQWLKMSFLPIHQQLQVHLLENEVNCPSKMERNDIYHYLTTCNIKGTYKIKPPQTHTISSSYIVTTNTITIPPSPSVVTSPNTYVAIGSKNTRFMLMKSQSEVVSRSHHIRCQTCCCAHPES